MLEVQAKVIAVLKADSALIALAPVYDEVPEGAARPFVEIGELEETLDNTFGKNGRDVLVSIHVYSEVPGYREAELILERLNVLLDDTLLPPTTSWRCGLNEYVIGSAQKEFDTVEVRHVIARYRFLVEALP